MFAVHNISTSSIEIKPSNLIEPGFPDRCTGVFTDVLHILLSHLYFLPTKQNKTPALLMLHTAILMCVPALGLKILELRFKFLVSHEAQCVMFCLLLILNKPSIPEPPRLEGCHSGHCLLRRRRFFPLIPNKVVLQWDRPIL